MNRRTARICFYIALVTYFIIIILYIIGYRGTYILYYLLGAIAGAGMFPTCYLDFKNDCNNDKVSPSNIKGLVATVFVFLICFFMLIKTSPFSENS